MSYHELVNAPKSYALLRALDAAHVDVQPGSGLHTALLEFAHMEATKAAELVKQFQQANPITIHVSRDRAHQSEAVWRKRLEAAAEELADVGAGECGRLDIVTRVRILKARVATLSAAGQVLSAHADRIVGQCANPIRRRDRRALSVGVRSRRANIRR